MALADFDIFFSYLEEKLTAYADVQPSGGKFTVETDFHRFQQGRPGCYVFLSNPQIQGDKQAPDNWQYRATFPLDCAAISRATSSNGSDSISAARLRYLVQQVLTVVFDQSDPCMGFDELGRVTELDVSSITPFSMETLSVLGFQGLRINVEASFGFEPSPVEGTALEKISSTAPLWAAQFDYEE